MEKTPEQREQMVRNALAGQDAQFLQYLQELEAAYYLRTKHDPSECEIVQLRKADEKQLYIEVAHIRPMKGDEDLYREVKQLRKLAAAAKPLLGELSVPEFEQVVHHIREAVRAIP